LNGYLINEQGANKYETNTTLYVVITNITFEL
jgi:hypothetical protein